MTEAVKLAKKKVVVLAASLCSLAAASATVPAMAARHGMHVLWIALPLVVMEVVAIAYTVVALFDLKRLERESAEQD